MGYYYYFQIYFNNRIDSNFDESTSQSKARFRIATDDVRVPGDSRLLTYDHWRSSVKTSLTDSVARLGKISRPMWQQAGCSQIWQGIWPNLATLSLTQRAATMRTDVVVVAPVVMAEEIGLGLD